MFRFSVTILFWLFLALPLRAEVPADIERLSRALGLPEIIDVLHDEGVDNGIDLGESMFPGRGGAEWRETLVDIYDVDRMSAIALTRFAASMQKGEVSAVTEFFEGELGAEIVALEISARQALIDDAVDEANTANVAQMVSDNDPRLELIRQFIEANDLLETNVVGALNSNFAFFKGLVDGGAYDEPLSEDKILSDVWEQEPGIRADTGEWLFSFLTMAYSPLSDADLLEYIEFSETEAGQALNTALFVGFDELFETISRELGLAAAQILASEEL